MTSPTKADLQAAVTRLSEQNAALRGLLEAVRDCANTPAAPEGQFSAEEELDKQRASHIRVWLHGRNFSSTRDVAHLTDLFRNHIAPVTYRSVCDEHITGMSPAALRYCQLDPGHDGDHSPEAPGPSGPPSAAEVYAGGSKGRAADIGCPAAGPRGGTCTAPNARHPMPHRDDAGFEWGTPEHCGDRPYPAGSEGDDGTECMLPPGHAGPHDDMPDEPQPARLCQPGEKCCEADGTICTTWPESDATYAGRADDGGRM